MKYILRNTTQNTKFNLLVVILGRRCSIEVVNIIIIIIIILFIYLYFVFNLIHISLRNADYRQDEVSRL